MSHLRAGQPIARRKKRRCDTEVTDVFPVIRFDVISSPIRDLNPFATDIAVLASPELDDTSDLFREWPLFLLPPRSTRHAAPMPKPNPVLRSIRAGDADTPAHQHRSAAGRHRKHVTAGREAAFRGTLVATAVAAGAVAAAINIAGNTSGAQAAAASASASARNSQPPPRLRKLVVSKSSPSATLRTRRSTERNSPVASRSPTSEPRAKPDCGAHRSCSPPAAS